ncbi:MAG: Mpo1-like protein [Candidatus Angelobacter sp.]
MERAPRIRLQCRCARPAPPIAFYELNLVDGIGYNPPMLGGRTSEKWIAQYASSHTHPVNRFCHSLGIPLIVLSLALAVAAIFYHPLWMFAAGLFVFGWLLQFIGHAFEHKEPEFFHDWRFLLVGVRWWWAKMRGRA